VLLAESSSSRKLENEGNTRRAGLRNPILSPFFSSFFFFYSKQIHMYEAMVYECYEGYQTALTGATGNKHFREAQN